MLNDQERYTAAIARELLGRADRGFSDGKHLRYDTISINLAKATYYDSSTDLGGDMVELARRIRKLENGQAEAFIEEVKAGEDARRVAHQDSDRGLPEDITPTFNLETERAIIGGLILHPELFPDVGEILQQGDITFWVHQAVFEKIGDTIGREKPLQIGALVDACGGDDGGDIVDGFTLTEYLARIAADAPDDFASKVRELGLELRDVTIRRDQADDDFDKKGQLEDARDSAKFKLRGFDDVKLQASSNYLVRGLMPRTGLIVIWGPPKCGKSFWTYDLAMHIALGMEYRGRKTVQGSVVYLMLEGEHGYGARVAAFKQRYLQNYDKPVPLYDVARRVDLVGDHATLIKDIASQLGDVTPALIVVDTLNRSLRGSESSDEDMSAYVKAADAIREAFQAAVAIIHHCGVNGERPRGHTSLTGAADAQLAVRRDDARNVVVRVEYMKDGKEGDQLMSRLDLVTVGFEPDNEPITSCVIVPLDGKVGERGFRANPQEKIFLQCLFEAIGQHGEPSANCGIDLPQSILKVVEYKFVKTALYEKMLGEEEDDDKHAAAVRQALSRCGKTLKAGGVIGSYRRETKGGKQWVWWTQKPVIGMPSTQPSTFDATDSQPDLIPGATVPIS